MAQVTGSTTATRAAGTVGACGSGRSLRFRHLATTARSAARWTLRAESSRPPAIFRAAVAGGAPRLVSGRHSPPKGRICFRRGTAAGVHFPREGCVLPRRPSWPTAWGNIGDASLRKCRVRGAKTVLPRLRSRASQARSAPEKCARAARKHPPPPNSLAPPDRACAQPPQTAADARPGRCGLVGLQNSKPC